MVTSSVYPVRSKISLILSLSGPLTDVAEAEAPAPAEAEAPEVDVEEEEAPPFTELPPLWRWPEPEQKNNK